MYRDYVDSLFYLTRERFLLNELTRFSRRRNEIRIVNHCMYRRLRQGLRSMYFRSNASNCLQLEGFPLDLDVSIILCPIVRHKIYIYIYIYMYRNRLVYSGRKKGRYIYYKVYICGCIYTI